MKFSDFFASGNIVADLKATGKEAAIHELVQTMCASGSLTKSQGAAVERAVMERERKGSTGIGKGVAVPHAKVREVDKMLGAFGRSAKGVEFGALDGQPVHLIFLLTSSPEQTEAHLEALRKVAALLKDDDYCAFLRRATSKKELADLLREVDDRVTA
jgi:nitrogen PTS system EIIA component